MKKVIARGLAVLFTIILLAAPVLAVPEDGQGKLDLLEEIAYCLDEYGLYPPGDLTGITADALEEDPGLFNETVESWLAPDKYAYLMTFNDYEESFGPAVSGGAGIGIEMDVTVPTGVYVVNVLPDGAAEKAGIEAGSQIVSADGIDLCGMNYQEARLYLIGEESTAVTVGYMQPGSDEIKEAELVREALDVSNVTYELIGGTNVGYIRILGFDSYEDQIDFGDAFNTYLPGLGAESVIIDLRGNPGGLAEIAFFIFDSMVNEEGLLFCHFIGNGRDNGTSGSFYTLGWTPEELSGMMFFDGIWEPENIIVLTDEKSASASEAFAGALQAHGLAEVVGTETVGKATSQYHTELTGGDVLVFSIAGVELEGIGSYEGVGIIPDHYVERESTPASELGYPDTNVNLAIFPGTRQKDRVIGLQERLALLGYYRVEPTGVMDGYTVWALNQFQMWQRLRVTPFASVPALRALEKLMGELVVYDDTQLAYALELCS
jgi:carboxyl-terminal processing protease